VVTRKEFQQLPYLLAQKHLLACGLTGATTSKYLEHGLLRAVKPAGFSERRVPKIQVAQLLGWQDTLDLQGWAREKPLFLFAAVHQWTGFDRQSVDEIVAAGGLVRVRLGGLGAARYRKEQIGEWIGL